MYPGQNSCTRYFDKQESMWWPLINVIRDEKLKAALNEIYLNQPIDHNITEDQLVKLTGVLELENKGIKDLTGINYASQLTGLYLNKNEIEDLTP